MTLTGVANTFGLFIVSVGRESLLLSLLLTMITCIVLGTGIPTIPNYIITAAIAGPALLALGVPLIVSHMFVFYFGIFADLTPPVALACFAAAPIARESGLKISYDAMKIATAGFVVPFMAVYAPELMLQPGGPLSQADRLPARRRLDRRQGRPRDRPLGRRDRRLPRRPAALAAAPRSPPPPPSCSCWRCRSPTSSASRSPPSSSASSGGAAAAPPRREPLHPRRRRRHRARRLGLHPRLAAFGRARRLVRDAGRSSPRASTSSRPGSGAPAPAWTPAPAPSSGTAGGPGPPTPPRSPSSPSPPPAPPAGGWRLCHADGCLILGAAPGPPVRLRPCAD